MDSLQRELKDLINTHSIDNRLETPDYVLAEYIVGCLFAYETVVGRMKKHGEPTDTTTDSQPPASEEEEKDE